MDAQRTNFAIEARHRLALDHPQPAEHLDGLVDDALRGLGGIELGDGRFATVLASRHVMRPRRAVNEQRRRIDLGHHFGERSEEHTSELQSLMRISYAVFCLKKKTTHNTSYTPLHR